VVTQVFAADISHSQIERPSDGMYVAHHDREDDGDAAHFLDDTEHNEADELYEGKEVNVAHWHVTQEHVVRLVLGRHEHHEDSLNKLKQQRHRRHQPLCSSKPGPNCTQRYAHAMV